MLNYEDKHVIIRATKRYINIKYIDFLEIPAQLLYDCIVNDGHISKSKIPGKKEYYQIIRDNFPTKTTGGLLKICR